MSSFGKSTSPSSHHSKQFLHTIRYVVFIFSLGCSCVPALDISHCQDALGMENGQIPDSDLAASTSFDPQNVGPHVGRVRVEKQGGAWCPKVQITSESEEWIQIDLHHVHVITATETQGRFGNGELGFDDFPQEYFFRLPQHGITEEFIS